MSSKKRKQRPGQGAGRGPDAVETARDRAVALIRFVILVAVSLLLIVGPFYRGLYFARELLTVHLISFALFALWWVVRLLDIRIRFSVAPLDICIFALGIFYLASNLWAIHPREAAGEFLKVFNYLVIYLLVFDLCRHLELEKMFPLLGREREKNRALPASLQVLLTMMVISGVAVACSGLAAVGGAEIKGAFVWGRLFSPLQYANAAAIYFLAALFPALGLMAAGKNRYTRALFMAAAMLLTISIALTYSRSVWLLAPPLALLFALSAGRGNILRLLLYTIMIFATAFPAAFAAGHFFQEGAHLAAWAVIAAAILFGLFLAALVELYISRVSPAGKAVLAGISLFTVCLAVFLWLQGEMGSPLYLEQAGGEVQESQYMEQVVSTVDGDTVYRLTLEVKAEGPSGFEEGEEPVAWKVAVLAAVADRVTNEYLTTAILEQGEQGDGEWQRREFAFKTPLDIRKLTIRLMSGDPGSTAIFRDVLLQGAGEEKALRFYAHRILPAGLYARITLFRTNLAEEPRIAHYGDAWKIICDNPIKGYGGGAWNCLYPSYMNRSYWTSEPHNHYLKVWLEAGLFAFLALVAILVAATVSFIRFIRQKAQAAEQRLPAAAIYFAAAALLLHGAVDFSLSLGAVSILLFTLLGCWRGMSAGEEGRDRKGRRCPAGFKAMAGFALTLLLFGCTFSLWRGSRLAEAALLAYDRGSVPLAEKLLCKAVKLDPLQALPCSILADIYKERAGASPERSQAVALMAKARDHARQAWEREPCNTTYSRKYSLILLSTGDLDGGLQLLKRNVELNPFHPDHYEQLAAALLAVAEHHLDAGKPDQAGLLLKQILDLEASMEQYHESTAALDYYLGKASYLMQDWKSAIQYFLQVRPDSPQYDEAQKYLKLMEDQRCCSQ